MYILLGATLPASSTSGCAAASFEPRVLRHFRVRHAQMAEHRELLTCCDVMSTNEPPQRETEQNAFTHEKAAIAALPHLPDLKKRPRACTGPQPRQPTPVEFLVQLELELFHVHAVLGDLANLHKITRVDVALTGRSKGVTDQLHGGL